jgi:enamine deaminase RidA (YjgF/YER057c/UK114 family)
VVHVAGQIGWDPESQDEVPDGFADQWDAALRNLVAVVQAAGSEPALIVSMTVYVTSVAEYHAAGKEVGAAWVSRIGKHFPAVTLIEVAKLVRDDARVEIAAVAALPEARA